MNDVVNIFLCKDRTDVIASMTNYADNQERLGKKVKAVRSRATVVVNDSWVTKFVSSPNGLDGMHVREIDISTGLATSGDLNKLKNMLTMARQGRIAMKYAQM